MPRFDGRIALVTGAGRGIGAAVAKRLAAEGATVVVSDVDAKNAERVAADIGGSAVAIACDVSRPASVDELHAAIKQRLTKLDAVVTAAGIVAHRAWDDVSFEEWKRVQEVNLDGTFLVCRAASKIMRENGYGRIVTIGSSSLYLGSPDMSHYIASKGGVMTLTRALATELGKYGITANCVSPGLTDTEGVQMTPHKDAFEEIERRQALKGRAVPERIAPVVAFFASEEAGWITGQGLVADGGVVRW